MHFGRTGQVERGHFGNPAQNVRGQQHPKCAASERQQDAFAEQLPDQAHACRAHRRAHRKFARAGGGPRQQQAGHIGARDQQHKTGRAEKHPQHGAHIGHQVVLHGRDFHRRSRPGIQHGGVRHGVLPPDHFQFRVGLRQRHARFQTAEYSQVRAQDAGRRGYRRRLGWLRHPDVHTRERKPEVRRKNSDYGVRCARQDCRFTGDLRICRRTAAATIRR